VSVNVILEPGNREYGDSTRFSDLDANRPTVVGIREVDLRLRDGSSTVHTAVPVSVLIYD